jgi:hypothetical protein
MPAAIPGDPLSSFVGNLGSGLGSGLGKGLGDAIGGGGGPLISGGGWDFRSNFDGSGWTVSTGNSRATGGARTGGTSQDGSPAGPVGLPQQAGLGFVGTLLMVGVFAYFIFNGGKL